MSEHRYIRRWAKETTVGATYGRHPNDRLLFQEMGKFQQTALTYLCAHNIFHFSGKTGAVSLGDHMIENSLAYRVDAVNTEEAELLEILEILHKAYSYLGQGGLKDRTGLMDFKHDVI